MSTAHLRDAQAISWNVLAEEFDFSPEEKEQIAQGAQSMIAASRVHRLAACVKALGGKLKIVADFGDESYILG